MKRPNYLSKYGFDWELLKVSVGGKSSIDSDIFLGNFQDREGVHKFLSLYGFDQLDPVLKAELFGNFQESLQFIRRYFLKENNENGLDIQVPEILHKLTDVSDLFLLATGNFPECTREQTLWASIVVKVMHTILHVDNDLRNKYFNVIQQQIFDKFYKFMRRDEDNRLYLGVVGDEEQVPLYEFETKAKKSRESMIIKLLHKVENVAEELFDRIGLRFVTYKRVDTLRVVHFLAKQHLVVPQNIKPSRSVNSLVDLARFEKKYNSLVEAALKNNYSEENFEKLLEQEIKSCRPKEKSNLKNLFTSSKYGALQFTCRQLIIYKNPLLEKIKEIRNMAFEEVETGKAQSNLSQKVLALDSTLISGNIRFFYPFEVQIVDLEMNEINTQGMASHKEYKMAQQKSAMLRLFKPLLQHFKEEKKS